MRFSDLDPIYTEASSVYQEAEGVISKHMGPEAVKTRRKVRADSIRNRERLLDAATRTFSNCGAQASLEAVEREAGVGIGTLYRHSPTREDLFEAVYRHEVDHLGDLAEDLAGDADPVEALRTWLHANVRLVATKKGMIAALQEAAQASNELRAYSLKRLTEALALLLGRGVASGELRADISPDELLRTLLGIFYSQGANDWKPSALRLVDVFVDGLRTRR